VATLNGFPWIAYKIYFDPHNVISAVQIFLRKAGANVTLRYKDLRDQLSRNDFWIAPEKSDCSIKRRFGAAESKATRTAWGIYVDKHPLGLQPVTEEEMQEAMDPRQILAASVGTMVFKDGDPRKGPLFTIIEGVVKYESGGG